MVEAVERRVYFRDIKPYYLPESLAALRGPRSGWVHLPRDVRWVPGDGWIDLDREGGRGLAYRSVITEGLPAQQVEVLNATALKMIWPDLVLPDRVRAMWQEKFPELASD